MSPGLPRSLLFCVKRRIYFITECAEVTKLLFMDSIGNSTILLRDFVIQHGGHQKKLALDLQESEKPQPSGILSKRRGTNNLISLKVDGSVLTDEPSIAQSMNSYFSLVFTTEDCVNFPTQDCIVDKKLANIDCFVDEVKRHFLKLSPPSLLGLTILCSAS